MRGETVSSRGRRVKTRVVVGGALLLSLCLAVVAACLPGWPIANSLDGTDDGHPAAATTAGPSHAAASHQTPQSNGPAGSTLPTTPTSSPTAVATKPPPTPRPSKPTPRPTPEPYRLYLVPILMYHRVVPTSEAGNPLPGLVVSPSIFSAQLKALHDAGWHSTPLATLAADMGSDRTVPAKTFVITFDDGWSDGYDYAFPIMREYGFVGTYFVISSRIDQRGFLSSEEMRTLEAAGNEIGNHTENHVSLTAVPLSRVRQEVENASEQIAKAVGHRPVSLAYPGGGVSTPVAIVVSQIPDIKIAVTEHPGQTETWFERYDTPRVRVHTGTTPAQLVASLNP